MGLERRGGSVLSVYAGRGEIASILAGLGKSEREHQRKAKREAFAEIERTDDAIDELGGIAPTIARAMLLASGCHTHQGQWRRWKRKKR